MVEIDVTVIYPRSMRESGERFFCRWSVRFNGRAAEEEARPWQIPPFDDHLSESYLFGQLKDAIDFRDETLNVLRARTNDSATGKQFEIKTCFAAPQLPQTTQGTVGKP